MSKRFLKHALVLLLVLVVCWVLISPAVDLEPMTLRVLKFIAVFTFLLGWLKICAIFPGPQLRSVEAAEIGTRFPAPRGNKCVSCVLLC